MKTTRFDALSRRSLLCGGLSLLGGRVFAQAGVLPQRAAGRRFYVAPTGSDTNRGSETSPFRTISGALRTISDLHANDTLVVMPGVYAEQVVIARGGDESGYLTLQSQVPHAARIRSPKNTYSAVNIVSNYVALEGFDVQAGGSGHGIEATFLEGNPANNGPHHIKIVNNVSHDNAGSGIGVAYGDFYTIDGNVCCRNCATNRYQGSGISIYAARAVAGATDAFRNFVRRNICFDNMIVDLPGSPEPPHSDGNGIIIDDLANSQSHYPAGAYPFETLVENNVSFRNGGRGVHVYLSDNVTVLNNTSYHNNRDKLNPGTWRGELSNVASSNTIWANNIGVADPAVNRNNVAINEASTEERRSSNVAWHSNLTFNGRPGDASVDLGKPHGVLSSGKFGDNLLGVDPLFVGGNVQEAADLRLRAGSPAVDAGTISYGASETDVAGHARVRGGSIDLGAFEYGDEEESRDDALGSGARGSTVR
ncbi:MAG TPA: right-handed parallel beta-helix repeat-containing protein [Pseudolabrys sp.]|nr:right-handed parallel beta-helix repeat-containing protein [Pseudolabrys sp.]